MLKFLVVLPAAVLFAFLPQDSPAPAPTAPAAQSEPAAPAAPSAPASAAQPAAQVTNPVRPTAESQAHAKMLFGIDCAICHGATGDGKGDLVADMKLSMKDMTDPDTLKNMSDGDIYSLIKDGRGKMPGEGARAKDADIWNLVIYVRSLSKK
jgi:mono/diheme cytochrome c family protein